MAQLQQVKEKEAHEPLEVEKPEQKKVYVIITITYSYVPKSSEYVPKKRKSLNNKIKNE